MRLPFLVALAALAPTLSAGGTSVPGGALRLPPAFVSNRGQLTEEASFVVQDGAMRLELGVGGFRIRAAGEARAMQVRFEGAAPVAPEPAGPARARHHYLRGSDPSRWIRDVPAYDGVRYRDLYPGVDLVVYARDGRLEYDLHVAPGARLDEVRLRCEGADALALEASGDLVATFDGALVRQRAPRSWQIAPDGTRLPLPSRFVRHGARGFGFAVEGRDPALPLVVDPVLVLRRSVGGTAADAATGVAFDAHGALYVSGWTDSGDFPLTPLAVDDERAGREVCVFKLAPDGTLVWATYLGGAYDDEASALALDADGSVVVVGRTKSSDFPVTPGAWCTNRSGVWDAFAARLTADGSSLAFSTFLGGRDVDVARSVAIGRSGSVFVAGTTRSRDYPCTSHAWKDELEGLSDAFVTKLDAQGVVAIYSTLLGGTREDQGHAVAVDSQGNACVVGTTRSLDFPTTRGAFAEKRGGSFDAFVTKLSFDGAAPIWSTFLGGASEDVAGAVVVSPDGAVTVGGSTSSDDFPVTGPELGPRGRDAFVCRLSSSGASLRWSRLFGGTESEACQALALADDGSVWLAGTTTSDDLPLRASNQAPGGGTDGLLARLEPEAGEADFVTPFGSGGRERFQALAVDRRNGRVAAVGTAQGIPSSARGQLGGPDEPIDDALVAVFSAGLCGPAAERHLVGTGCGANLSCGSPVVGRRLTFDVVGAPREREGVLLLSPPPEKALVLEGWCDVSLDLGRLDRPHPFRTDRRGVARLSVEIPADAELCGVELVFQAVVLAPGEGPLGFGALSQALLVTLGD